MSEVLKKCNGCGKIKPLSDFPIDRSRKDGRFHWCFDCNKKKASERRKKIKHLDIENVKLKVLLKEWVEAYPVVAVTCDLKNFAKIKELLDKTNEVLK